MSEINIRRAKLESIIGAGLDPYPARVRVKYDIGHVIKSFSSLASEEIFIAGRLRSRREHGGSVFGDLEDGMGRIQVYFKKDELGSNDFDFFIKNIDIGDFLEIKGKTLLTKKGEPTILVEEYTLIAKSLRTLPEKWHGLKDIETRLRKRYLDLLGNREARGLFQKRGLFIKSIRDYLDGNGFLEVETSVLEHVTGGADALPFVTHHNALGVDLYLRISLELALKRLLVGGFDRVYEIGKVFRNEGIDREHLQEFTMLEFYWAYQDYNGLMGVVENMYVSILDKVFGRDFIEVGRDRIDFRTPWQRIDYYEFFKENTGIDLSKVVDEKELLSEVKKLKLKEIDLKLGQGRIIDAVYKRLCRPKIKGPAFLINHPLSLSPLAKKMETDPRRVERFQIVIAGSEVGNAFSELNDSIDQRNRFEEQMKLRKKGDKEAHMMDEDFVEAMEFGMPPSAGFGVGIDRLFMLFSGVDSIRETILFPQMR